MYELGDFFRDLKVTFKSIWRPIRNVLLTIQVVVGGLVFFQLYREYAYHPVESFFWSFLAPIPVIWGPLLYRKWKRLNR